MSITLDPVLKAAQDGNIHKPIVALHSYPPEEVYPAVAFPVNGGTNQYTPKLLMLSDGRLFTAYRYKSGSSYFLYFVWTDTERTTWFTQKAYTGTYSGENVVAFDIVELADGNIGILAITAVSSNHNLRRIIVTKEGVMVSAASIFTRANTYIGEIGLYKLANGTYRYVFCDRRTSPDTRYYFTTATSTNFTTWTAQSTFEPVGIGLTTEFGFPTMFEDATRGELFLFFEFYESYNAIGSPIVNIFYCISTDGGATWGNPVRVTNYQVYGSYAQYPSVDIYETGVAQITYTNIVRALYISTAGAGFPDRNNNGAITLMFYFDPVTRLAYHLGSSSGYGYENLSGLTVIDIDTLTPLMHYDGNSTPPIPPSLLALSPDSDYRTNLQSHPVDGKVCIAHEDDIYYIDTVTNTITGPYPIIPIRDYNPGSYSNQRIHSIAENNGTLWFMGSSSSLVIYNDSNIQIVKGAWGGGANPSDFSQVCLYWRDVLGTDFWGMPYVTWSFEEMLVCCTIKDPISSWYRFFIVDLNTGTLIANLGPEYPGMPYPDRYGGDTGFTTNGYAINGNVYICFVQATNNIPRGVLVYNIQSGIITQLIPPWDGPHSFEGIKYEPTLNALIMYRAWSDQGFVVYYIDTGEWVQYNDAKYPGTMPMASGYNVRDVYYDATQNSFVVTVYGPGGADHVGIFPKDGKLGLVKTTQFLYAGSNWEIGSFTTVNADLTVRDAVIQFNFDSQDLYYLWDNYTTDEVSHTLEWIKVEQYFNLSKYLLDEVSVKRSITDAASELRFSLSHGHLFDPFNVLSLLKPYIKKGRRLRLYFGENVSGNEFTEAQGLYFVSEVELSYTRGEYPIVSVTALDYKHYLTEREVVTTIPYYDIPSDVFKDIAQTYGELLAGDIDPITFLNEYDWNIQFVNQTVYEMLNTIANRFGYVPRFLMNGHLNVTKVGDSTVDHAYSNQNAIIRFTPDSSYSDFTNRVTVTGEEDFDTEVVHDEEKVATLNGTIGWWGPDKHDFTIYYSEDKSRRIRYPRLVKIQLAAGIAFRMAGNVEESISYVDPNEQYCVVTIKAADLRYALVALIGMYVIADLYLDTGGGIGAVTIFAPIGRWAQSALLVAITMILGSVVNYYYEIYGLPVGKIRRSLQATANDVESQNYLGRIMEKTIEGWHCHSVSDCYQVAAYELNLVKWQRNRIKLEKIAHLQDEEGDTISILHPISGVAMKIFITDLTRKFKKGDDGYFLDEIEGWVL